MEEEIIVIPIYYAVIDGHVKIDVDAMTDEFEEKLSNIVIIDKKEAV
jgi:ribonuclease PH